jgi:hypothetical protein
MQGEQTNMKSKIFKLVSTAVMAVSLLGLFGCGGTPKTSPNPTSQHLIDPSGNWQLKFTDSNSNLFLLSALFNQVGAVVNGVNISEVGNGSGAVPPTPFNCVAQPDVSFTNGLVADVSTFTGTLSGNFGTLAFTTTLNDPGTEAVGTYTLTPGAAGNCLGIALTGTLTADEVPSVSGNWTGTVACVQNCPTGTTSGAIAMTMAQDDATGSVTGSYMISGIPGISSGTIVPNSPSDLLSGPNLEAKLQDNNGTTFFFSGGPVTARPLAGLGLDRSYQGELSDGNSVDPLYTVNMSH